MFNVDFIDLIKQNIPAFLRKPKALSWIKTLCMPIIQLYADFNDYRQQCDYLLNHTSQVIYLEKLLNDKFRPIDLDPIYIEDTPSIETFNIYNSDEGLETCHLYNQNEPGAIPLILYNEEEIYMPQDFIVYIVSDIYDGLTNQQFTEMRNMLNTFKFAGVRYTIKSF